MRIIRVADYEEMSLRAADFVQSQIYLKPSSVLAMPAGGTPLGLYRQLTEEKRQPDLSALSFFSLDEYCGLPPEHGQSYHHYLDKHLFRPLKIRKRQIHLPNGMARDIQAECRRYEELISSMGGFDLLVAGIGGNGHIGFNEPDDAFQAETHQVSLQPATISANARFFSSRADVPSRAVTVGIKAILQSRLLLLLASGEAKAVPLGQAVSGRVTSQLPASVIQLHPNVVVIADREAARLLPS